MDEKEYFLSMCDRLRGDLCHLIKERYLSELQDYIRRQPAAVPEESAEPEQWSDYDPVHLNDYGCGNISWWQDYIRSEVARANEFWRKQVSTTCTAPQPPKENNDG